MKKSISIRGVYDKTLVVKLIDDDPIKALSRLGKEKLKGKSIETLRKEAMEEIEKNTLKKYAHLAYFFNSSPWRRTSFASVSFTNPTSNLFMS